MATKNKYSILFEDAHFVAVNKPSGMLSIPDREQSEKSLKEFLIEKYGSIFTVHRLDKDTSGLIIFAKEEQTHKLLSRLFEDRKIEKFYLGVVHGCPEPLQGDITAPISEHPHHKGKMQVHRDGKASHTGYETIQAHRLYSLVSFQLHTGRTHQIRVHAKEMGHPLICDPLYGDGEPLFLSSLKKKYKLSKHDEAERPIISRLALHSYKLIFKHPITQEPMELQAEMPKTFRALMQQQQRLN